MSSTVNDLVRLAREEIGYLEKSRANYDLYGANCLYHKTKFAGADNYTKYSYELKSAKLGHPNGQPWCMTFICWILYKVAGADEADRLLCGMLASASTMDTKDAMIRAGRQVPLNMARAGDIVFRSRKGGGHVGLVVGRSAEGKIITIEGNTSKTDATAWNGGAVAQHTGGSWEWCCRPDYKDADSFRWIQADGHWYYQNGHGENVHGWAKIKETAGPYYHWYWFDSKGAAASGARQIDGKWYFFQPDGDLACAQCVTDTNGALVIWSMTE